MRFLFGMEPIAYLDSKLADSFRLMGFVAHKYSYSKEHIFYDMSDYLYPKHDFEKMLLQMLQYRNLDTIDDFLLSDLYGVFEKEIEFYLKNYDVFCFVNGKSLLPCNFDFPILKKHNKKVLSIFSGTEIRHDPYAKDMWGLNGFDFPQTYTKSKYPKKYLIFAMKHLANFGSYETALEKKRQHSLMAEIYADLILSVPEMSGVQTSPYLPYIHSIDTRQIKFKNNKRTKPIVAHIPSEPIFKKTNFILEQVESLKSDGLDFEFIYLTKVPHTKALEVLEYCDILIDQMSLFPATLAHEAMASGCVCLTGNHIAGLPIPLKTNNCPSLNIDPKNIKEVLKQQIVDFESRNDLIEQGKNYIDSFCRIEVLAHRVLDSIDKYAKKDFEYFPSYAFENMVDLDIESNFIFDLQVKSTLKNGIFKKENLDSFFGYGIKDLGNHELIEWKNQTMCIAPYININIKHKKFFEGFAK